MSALVAAASQHEVNRNVIGLAIACGAIAAAVFGGGKGKGPKR